MSARPRTLKLRRPEARQAAGRSGLYAFFARALAVPDEDFFQDAVKGELARAVAAMAGELPFALALPAPALAAPAAFAEFQSEYLSWFEVGMKGPPCPLYEGAVRQDLGRKAILEELLRFYEHFGLQMSEAVRELPDRLGAELEFMHYLAFLEAQGCERGASPADLIRAERDFLARHLAVWVPELAAKAQAKNAPPFYRDLLQGLAALVRADLDHLKRRSEEVG